MSSEQDEQSRPSDKRVGGGGGGLGEVQQEKEKRALGNKTACILSFFLNRVKIKGVVLNRVRVSKPQRLTYTQIIMDI